MRENFEKFAAEKGWNLQRFKEGRWPGEYVDGSVQCAWVAVERAIAESQALQASELLLQFVKRFRIKPSSDICYICKCRYKHAEDCLVRKAEQIL